MVHNHFQPSSTLQTTAQAETRKPSGRQQQDSTRLKPHSLLNISRLLHAIETRDPIPRMDPSQHQLQPGGQVPSPGSDISPKSSVPPQAPDGKQPGYFPKEVKPAEANTDGKTSESGTATEDRPAGRRASVSFVADLPRRPSKEGTDPVKPRADSLADPSSRRKSSTASVTFRQTRNVSLPQGNQKPLANTGRVRDRSPAHDRCVCIRCNLLFCLFPLSIVYPFESLNPSVQVLVGFHPGYQFPTPCISTCRAGRAGLRLRSIACHMLVVCSDLKVIRNGQVSHFISVRGPADQRGAAARHLLPTRVSGLARCPGGACWLLLQRWDPGLSGLRCPTMRITGWSGSVRTRPAATDLR